MPGTVHPDALEAARTGAGWAFERIYTELAGPVCGYLRSQGVDDPDGETNEVFLRAFRRFAAFDGDAANLRSWIFTIAHNRIIDGRRFRSRRPAEPRATVDRAGADFGVRDPTASRGGWSAAPAASAADDALARLDEERLLRQLDLLPADQRDVLLLRFIADLSLDETASAMGRTVGAVKALQHRALATARRRLAEILPEAVSQRATVALTEA